LQKSMIKLLSIADIISIINVIFGFLAILFLLSNLIEDAEIRLRVSFSFILIALLVDGLDGIVARKIKRSDIGEHLDSMADMVSMIIATSLFIFVNYQEYFNNYFYYQIFLLVALVLFLSFGTIRLASYYLMKDENFFIGLPAPAGTVILLILAFFKIDFIYILIAVIIVGAAMVSNIKFPKPRKIMDSIATVLIFFTLVMGKSYYGFAPLLLLTAILLYTISGPIFIKIFGKKTIKNF
jgi:CDP-diacylglycerol--serine O-phosphatidyltransferase